MQKGQLACDIKMFRIAALAMTSCLSVVTDSYINCFYCQLSITVDENSQLYQLVVLYSSL